MAQAAGRNTRRGFTLVELMLVVAILGVMAALAMYGVRRYLATAKSAEARHTVGAVARAAHLAYEQEGAVAQELAEGTNSTTTSHRLCESATAVPATVPLGRKYQPKTANGADFDTGDAATGWKCLRFRIAQPIAYQYAYTKGAAASGSGNSNGNNGKANGVSGNGNGNGNNGNGNGNGGSNGGKSLNPNACVSADCYEVLALGDLDGDGIQSQFSLVGSVMNGELKRATQLFTSNETE
jgi:type IV pilus assembly protein PilA